MNLTVTPISFTSRGKLPIHHKKSKDKSWMIPYYEKQPIELHLSPWQRFKRFLIDILGFKYI